MRIGLLGAVEATTADGRPVALGGLRLRGLLARLALDAGRPVPSSTLVDDLWGAAPPEDAANALQALVSRLRRAIGAGVVVTDARGYRLQAPPDAVDVRRFDALVAEGTLDRLREALALWRGPALADVAELPFAEAAAARLADRRASAVERAASVALDRGDAAAEIDRLTAQLDAAPLRETTAALLARCLHVTGRQADALAVLDRTRDQLVAQLGVDPGAEWAAARLAVLRDERPAPARPVQLPLTSFVGRDRDVERLRSLLPGTRLVTLIGPGGAGKTRLAVQLAAEFGGCVAELAGLTAPEQLPAALLTAVGGPDVALRMQDDPGADVLSRLVGALSGRDVLLVLDNCEHLVEDVARLVATLLAVAPRLRMLATSREPLGVPGEVLHPVAALADDDAVQLFADRAAAASPGFTLSAAGVEGAVREICRRLDGQPLPIELAAARTRSLSPAEIAARLDDRFRLLTSGARTALPRHQTLRAVVDWSWDLLSEPERTVARRLGAFAGSASAAAAELVCSAPGGIPAEDVFELLASLVDRSLVVAVPQPGGTTRYRMLETIRVYAMEKLAESGEEPAARAAHAAFVVDLVETAEPHLRGRDQLVWLDRLLAEADEIVAALDRAITAADAGVAQRIIAGMVFCWTLRGMIDEGTRWVDAAVALVGPAPPQARALTTAFAGLSAVGRGDLTAAKETIQQALALAEAVPQPWHPVLHLLGPGYTYYADGDPEPLHRLIDETDDTWLRGIALMMLAQAAENEGRLDEQRRTLRRAHAAFQAVGERFGLGMTVHSLAELEDLAGNHEAAAQTYDEAVALASELGNADDQPQFMVRRAMLEARRGNPTVARDRIRRILADHVRHNDNTGQSAHYVLLAEAERRSGDIPAARAALETARAQLERSPANVPQMEAFLGATQIDIDLTDGDLRSAGATLSRAADAAEYSSDGPIAALVAAAAARLALATGDARAAATAIGVSIRRRGAPDLGDVESVATHAAVTAELGADAETAIEAGRALDVASGMAVVRMIAAQATNTG